MILQRRITHYLSSILQVITMGGDKKFRHKDIAWVNYAGGTLVLSIKFKGWNDTELIFLNLNGQMNSSIYGEGKMTKDNQSLCQSIYLLVKGSTPYFDEASKEDYEVGKAS